MEIKINLHTLLESLFTEKEIKDLDSSLFSSNIEETNPYERIANHLIDKYNEEYLILISQSLPKTRAKETLTKLINHVIP